MILNEKDKDQIKRLGIDEDYIVWQIEMFKRGTPYVRLIRPCTVGDGIIRLSDEEAERYVSFYEDRAKKLRKIKFVPASGAATRMFKALFRFYNEEKELKEIMELREDEDARDLIQFIQNIKRFAFYEDLKNVLEEKGYQIDQLLSDGNIRPILYYLLTEEGLNYGNLPKALIKFHKYPDGSRTAFEEHLVEASGYAINEDGCYLHFTVSPEHRKRFENFFEKIRHTYEERFCFRYKVEFSEQEHSTDTISVDMENRPFRLEDGSLLFRPAGHGALLKNLNSIDADLIFIKNIDNVVPDRLKPQIYFWKKALGGYLLMIKEKVDGFVKEIRKRIDEAEDFCKRYLYRDIPDGLSTGEKIKYIFEILNRPLRVCGMVRNVKEPGGGPFWVEDKNGNISLQIVETAQVDMSSKEQREIFNSSTHFNPVDIVCSIKDWEGKKFDLFRYRNEDAVFITEKSKNGKPLKALELPGLWNGGMAYWNTIFIEVPSITFNPVKKVIDLLRENHQG